LIIALSGVRAAYGQTEPSAYTDAEAYAVYSVLLTAEWPVTQAKAKKLVIETETVDYPKFSNDDMKCLVSPKGEESIYDPVITAYRAANKTPSLLQPRFDSPISYQLVSKSSVEDIFVKKGVAGWEDFYAKYPESGGVISMSAVGFNADKTIALVYMGHSCGGLCGGGTYHVLRKTDGKWAEIKWNGMSCTWAS
jgi:hypothetical protein